jgi:hypothetical protein
VHIKKVENLAQYNLFHSTPSMETFPEDADVEFG